MSEQRKKRIAHIDTAACVACGCCVKVCRLGAVAVFHGMYAHVNPSKCVGCGLCQKTCPADVIVIEEVGA